MRHFGDVLLIRAICGFPRTRPTSWGGPDKKAYSAFGSILGPSLFMWTAGPSNSFEQDVAEDVLQVMRAYSRLV